MGKAKKVGIGFGIVILLFFVIIIIAAIGFDAQEERLSQPSLSPAEIKAKSLKGISYDDLMRNNENYVNEFVYFKGKVLQVQNVYGDIYALRVGITEKTFFYDDPIYANYAGPRILEDDIVEFWGVVKGLKEYTAVLGNEVTIPEIDVQILNVVKKAGN